MFDLVLIDANNILLRSHFGRPIVNDSKGNIQGIIGLINITLRHYLMWRPKRLVICWDTLDKTFRHDLYQEYKANRKDLPEEALAQIPRAKRALENLGFVQVEAPGYEADDIIGTLATQAEKEDLSAWIISGDKDLWQLISRNISVEYRQAKQAPQSLTLFNFTEKHLIEPGQMLDYKALVGDSSDNIPGVPGIGDKTAMKLLRQGLSLNDLLQYPELLPIGQAKKLVKYKEQALLSRKLAEIVRDVPVSLPQEATALYLKSPLCIRTLKALGLDKLIA